MDGSIVAEQTLAAPRTDGRNARSRRSRDKILYAARSLMCEGTFAISVVEVARRAGVCNRTVFQLFHDIDSLKREALDNAPTRRAIIALVASSTDDDRRNARIVQAVCFGKV